MPAQCERNANASNINANASENDATPSNAQEQEHLGKWTIGENGMRYNKRMVAEATKQMERRDRLAANGQKRGRPQKQKVVETEPTENLELSENNLEVIETEPMGLLSQPQLRPSSGLSHSPHIASRAGHSRREITKPQICRSFLHYLSLAISMQTPDNPSDEGKPVISSRGRRLRPVAPKELLKLRQAEMDYRFVREVEHLEREGRVSSRSDLEEAVGLSRADILAIRAGKRGATLLNVVLLHEKYRGDRDFIMYGVRNKELSAPYISGVGRIDRYDPYIFQYASPARWKVGPREETQPEYCPQDPRNEQWIAPKLKSVASKKKPSTEHEEENSEE
jgi:hypothetical protein